jgi:hypothetical protein
MSSKRETTIDVERGYEENEIGLKGIVWFAVGLVMLIVITFALMWALLNVLKDYSKENAPPANPLAMNDRERLPPEPRLQSAPGFGVDSEKGRVNLELLHPQAEYRELAKQWADAWEHGQKDQHSGAVTFVPVEEAKQRFLSQSAKARTGPDAGKVFEESRMFVSDASSGRMATEKRR